ncbi:MAG: OmpA family protein [Bacteroidota bacterium]|nr:OmpA family protein [Bacteroidota bacterium]
MASKKYTLLAGTLCLLFSSAFSQAQIRSYEDSSVIPTKRMPQYTEFMNGTNNYPAKPRNQWEVGIKAGMFRVSGDVASQFAPGFAAHVRKAFGYVFSMRLEYTYGIAKGLDWTSNQNYAKNPAWGANLPVAQRYSAPVATTGPGGVRQIVSSTTGTIGTPFDPVFYNYKTNVNDLSLEGVFTLNNIRFHKAKTGITLYGFAGFGGMTYNTKVNALNGSTKYNFSSIAGNVYKNRKDTRKALKAMMDKSYETPADNQGDRRPKLFGNTFKPSGTIGAGIAYKISKKVNIALEDRVGIVKDDLLDGQRWQEQAWGDASLTGDYDSYNFLSLGLNINIGAKSVEPLWWVNPLDYAYAEIRNPKKMNIPKPVLPDSDGDGVTDQFDREQTPAGCPVDSHGVSRDTDGDGVPDCKDKELVTPTYCQPVDADGVGKCPCPDSSCITPYLKGLEKKDNDCSTKLGALPSVSFKAGKNDLTEDAKAVLAMVAAKMKNSPECKVVVIGYCASDKKQQQLSWDHVNKVITYLVEKEGISADRFIFNYGQEGGDCNTVDIRGAAANEEGPNTVAPPHPNLRKK